MKFKKIKKFKSFAELKRMQFDKCLSPVEFLTIEYPK